MGQDVLAFRPADDGTILQMPVDEQSGGEPAAGLEFLLQRFFVELMTELNSIPGLPSRGSAFITRLRTRVITESDVFAAFAGAVVGVKVNLASEDSDTDPPEEKLQNAVLQQVRLKKDSVSLVVKVTSQAATTVTVVWPISFFT